MASQLSRGHRSRLRRKPQQCPEWVYKERCADFKQADTGYPDVPTEAEYSQKQAEAEAQEQQRSFIFYQLTNAVS